MPSGWMTASTNASVSKTRKGFNVSTILENETYSTRPASPGWRDAERLGAPQDGQASRSTSRPFRSSVEPSAGDHQHQQHCTFLCNDSTMCTPTCLVVEMLLRTMPNALVSRLGVPGRSPVRQWRRCSRGIAPQHTPSLIVPFASATDFPCSPLADQCLLIKML